MELLGHPRPLHDGGRCLIRSLHDGGRCLIRSLQLLFILFCAWKMESERVINKEQLVILSCSVYPMRNVVLWY